MKNMFFNSVLVAFVLLVASCSKQPEAKVDVMSFTPFLTDVMMERIIVFRVRVAISLVISFSSAIISINCCLFILFFRRCGYRVRIRVFK